MFKVAITTRNRPNEFNDCYKSVRQFVKDEDIIVIDDNSDVDYSFADYRFNERVGIPRAKNKCVELFMQSNADYLFMLDDDVIIKSKAFFDEYIKSGINHLCYTFYKPINVNNGIKLHKLGNGCAMFFTRKCFEAAGGFDTNYGLGKFEHVDLSRRLFNLGLIEHPFIDLVGSHEWIESLDRTKSVKRSFDIKENGMLINQSSDYFESQKNSTKFIDYK